MARLGKIKQAYRNFNGGINDFVNPFIVRDDQSPFQYNCTAQRPGILSKAEGYVLNGGPLSTTTGKGLFVFERDGEDPELVKADGSGLHRGVKVGETITWNAVGGEVMNLSDSTQCYGVSAYMDGIQRLYVTSGFDGEVVYMSNSEATTRLPGIKAKYIAEYGGRLYLANLEITIDGITTRYPTRVMTTEVGDDTFDLTFSSNYFDVTGSPITSLKNYANRLFIHTGGKFYGYDGYAFNEIPGGFGTVSHRSVVNASGYLLWFNRLGVYMYAGEEMPKLISRSVQGWIDVVSSAQAVSARQDKYGRYCLYIGDVTYEENSHSDVILIYDIALNSWEIQTDRPYKCGVYLETDGEKESYSMDTALGNVYLCDSGYGLGTDSQESVWYTPKWGINDKDNLKQFFKTLFYFKPTGANEYLTVKHRFDGETAWRQTGDTDNNVLLSGDGDYDKVELGLKKASGNFIQFRISHTSATSGFDIYEINIQGDEFDTD